MNTRLEDLEDLAAIVLVPTSSFKDVLVAADPSLADELEDWFDHSDSQTVVLVPSPEDDEELETFLTPHKKALAEKELAHWIENPAQWPKNLTDAKFDEWFEVRFHSVVLSVGEEE
ncbi:MAG: hypothetical protein H6686_02320 [Fibrobacteria bacterium]|nr:hypothetical protein [Fibrobacteria bacterium]